MKISNCSPSNHFNMQSFTDNGHYSLGVFLGWFKKNEMMIDIDLVQKIKRKMSLVI